MKNHIAFKFLSIVLAAAFLLVALGSACGIIVLIGSDLYDSTVEEAYDSYMWAPRHNLAVDLAHSYASLKLGRLPEEYYEQYYGYEWRSEYFPAEYYYYSIFDNQGVMVESTTSDVSESTLSDASFYEIELTDIRYRSMCEDGSGAYTDDYFDAENDCYVEVSYNTQILENCTVQLYLLPGAYSYDTPWLILQELYTFRYQLFWVLGASLLLFTAVIIYLFCTAGKKPGSDEIRASGLNRLPLDLYTACGAVVLFILFQLACYLLMELIYDMPQLLMCLLLVIGSAGSLITVALLFAWSAQLKMPNRFWLRNTLIGRIVLLIGRALHWLLRALRSVIRMLPVMWQWVVTAVLMGVVPFLLFLLYLFSIYYDAEVFFFLLFLLSILADVGITLYGSYCFGLLAKSVKRMSQGDLHHKISYKHLLGCFRDFAICLNSMTDATSSAVERQMRSERMKTELITNVSHDIKTPLTSIINFVDLLQKPHTPEQEQEYLEVLSRQSAQMKKLIEDLMELSKANSGNISVNPQNVDAVEAVNQALGEFSDKLEAAGLTPVFRQPEQPVYIYADGRHVWRVLFNLLTNAVKYALPGTRLYIDLMRADSSVILSIKNVSRAELNISAEELMERFVQGDASRKSDGSGLGLNIAKSLMEVQHGQLQLLLDGDLFKVTLTFPAGQM